MVKLIHRSRYRMQSTNLFDATNVSKHPIDQSEKRILLIDQSKKAA